MLISLAWRNARKSLSDYLIYFLTLSISIAIFYAFISVYPQILATIDAKMAEENMGSLITLRYSMYIATAFVSLMFAFLVIYSNIFFFKKREKEFGLYLLVGLEWQQVGFVVLFEILLVSLASFGCGIGLGIGISQLLGLFTSNLFVGSFDRYAFFFSLTGLLETGLFFLLIFVAVSFTIVVLLKKSTILGFLHGEKKNESEKIMSHKTRGLVLLTISIILLLACYAMMYFFFLETSFIVFILGTISAFMFFLSFSGLLFRQIKGRPSSYYRGLNLFVTKELSSHINTSSMSLAFVSLSLILTILLMSLGFGIQLGYTGTDNWFGFAYVGIYMGVSFMLVSSAILAIRQLSDVSLSRERYVFLRSLGADEGMIRKALFKEEALYFLYPLLFAGVASFFGLLGASLEAAKYLHADIMQGILASLGIVLGIYGFYFLLTYLTSLRYIESKPGK